MPLTVACDKIREKLSFGAPFQATFKCDFGEDGVIFIDTRQTPPLISTEDQDAETIFKCSLDTFMQILNGTQDPNLAFMTGKLKIKGAMGNALKLSALLED